MNNQTEIVELSKIEKLKLQRQIQNQKYRATHGSTVNKNRRDKYNLLKDDPEFKLNVNNNRKIAYQKAKAKRNITISDEEITRDVLLSME